MASFGMYGAFAAHKAASAAASSAARGEARANTAQRGLASVEERLDKLLLVNMAVWELLKENTSLNEDDLLAKVHEIDMRDGVADGKVTPTVQKCPKCDRTMSPKHRKCLYCGAGELKSEAYDSAK